MLLKQYNLKRFINRLEMQEHKLKKNEKHKKLYENDNEEDINHHHHGASSPD